MKVEKRFYDLRRDTTTFDVVEMPCGHSVRAEFPFSPTVDDVGKWANECPICLKRVGMIAYGGPFDGPLNWEQI